MAISSGDMIALSKEGELLWITQSFCNENSSPVIARDGTIYLLNQFGLAKLTPNGRFDPAFNLKCSGFALNEDGTILVRNLQL